jgi:RNA polymerase sigma factor (TIGR02999 family)
VAVADGPQTAVENLLDELNRGNQAALGELYPLVYAELGELAHRLRRRWHGDYTLNTTALMHEGYLKLAERKRLHAETRVHFLALAARAMRHVLVNYARDRKAQKRGAGVANVELDTSRAVQAAALSAAQANELLALHEALQRLEQVDARQSRIVECRFFGGMTVEETAAAVGVSARTVKRDWAVAQAWLHDEMGRL